MRLNTLSYVFLLYVTILFLSVAALITNYFIYQFPGNNYFPPQTPGIGLIVLLIYVGSVLNFGKNNRLSKSALELLNFFLAMTLVALATNAVQLTPFLPIDKDIVIFESYFNINLPSLMEWTHKHTLFKNMLIVIYSSLHWQMSIIPLIVIACKGYEVMKEYYFLLLFTTLTGFLIYYFFPTTAPASIMNSPLFTPEQITTGYKFKQIHSYIQPTTIEGGLIALPSFHTIWALLCVYLLKQWPVPCVLLLIMNSFLIASCILLGWHYPVDILSALLLVWIGYFLLYLCKSKSIREFS